ncbi:hypothetical protein BGZ67_001098, partial [Mortierella alpina]
GAILNIKRLGNILCPTEDDDCTPDTFEDAEVNLSDNTWTDRNHPSAGTTFVLGRAHAPARPFTIMRLGIANVYKSAALSLGPASESRSCSRFYTASSSQLVLILNGFLQVWRLPSEANQQYELVHVEAFVAVSKAHSNKICITKTSWVRSCTHGRKFTITIDPIKWVSDLKNAEIEDDQEEGAANGGPETEVDSDREHHPDSDQPQTLTFPRVAGETFLASEKYRYEEGVASLLDTYADSGPAIRDAIIRFLVDRIRPFPKYSSSLVILCRSWNHGNRLICEEVIAKLLPEGDPITWIPDSYATKNEDPLSILTKIARSSPSVLDACKVIMSYYVQVYLRRIAYIPVSDRLRDYIVENSTIVYSPWQWIWFRKTSLRLERIKKPVMQLHVTTGGRRNKADTFTRPIYVAAFDALWHFKDSGESEAKRITGASVVKQVSIVKPWSTITPSSIIKRWLAIVIGPTMKQDPMTAQESTHESVPEAASTQEATAARGSNGLMNQGAMPTQRTTWWKTLFHMIWFKFHLRTPTYVTCHDFSVEFRNNPAIAALVEYKWNTIAYAYWAGVAVAIIAVGSVFMWLELVQAFKNFRRYTGALINVAFANSDDGFSLIESRLHYIELAENLSYHIPGFRQTYNWFPREIYYSATAREIQIHEETIKAAEGEAKDSLENDPAIQELREQVQDLKHQLVSQQEREERRFEELKGLLLGRAENHKAGTESEQ